MDEIKLTGLKIFGHHGVLEEEKKNGQCFVVDITLECDFGKAAKSDDLTKTVNYAEMTDYVNQIFDETNYDLIEAVVYKLAEKLILKYDLVEKVSVVLHKPSAPIQAEFTDVSVSTSRGRHRVFVAVGSNLGDSQAIIEAGKTELFSDERIKLIKEATLIKTKPYGVTEQPDFVNGMWLCETIMEPEELLDKLHEVEAGQKRERIVHWGPRTLDLDIIYFDDVIIETADLTIPHVDMINRSFVLEPLMEIAPYKRHPINGLTAAQMLEKL